MKLSVVKTSINNLFLSLSVMRLLHFLSVEQCHFGYGAQILPRGETGS